MTIYSVQDYHLKKLNTKRLTGIDYIDFSIKEFIESGDMHVGEIVLIDDIFYTITTKEKFEDCKRHAKHYIGNKEIINITE